MEFPIQYKRLDHFFVSLGVVLILIGLAFPIATLYLIKPTTTTEVQRQELSLNSRKDLYQHQRLSADVHRDAQIVMWVTITLGGLLVAYGSITWKAKQHQEDKMTIAFLAEKAHLQRTYEDVGESVANETVANLQPGSAAFKTTTTLSGTARVLLNEYQLSEKIVNESLTTLYEEKVGFQVRAFKGKGASKSTFAADALIQADQGKAIFVEVKNCPSEEALSGLSYKVRTLADDFLRFSNGNDERLIIAIFLPSESVSSSFLESSSELTQRLTNRSSSVSIVWLPFNGEPIEQVHELLKKTIGPA